MNIEFNCPKCGQLLAIDSKYGGTKVECAKCKDTIEVPKPVAEIISPQRTTALKSPGVAAVLSFFITGLGQIYNGQVAKGICFMIAYVNCLVLAITGVGLFFLIPLWIWGMADAHKIAELTNRKGKVIPSRVGVAVFLLFLLVISAMIIPALKRAKESARVAEETITVKSTEAMPASGISFEDVQEVLGKEGVLTDLQKKDTWEKKFKGKSISWVGSVDEVSAATFTEGAYVTVRFGGIGVLHLHCSIKDKAEVMHLKKGQKIRVCGVLKMWNQLLDILYVDPVYKIEAEPTSEKQPVKKKTKAVALSWHQIKSWEGSGIKDTEPFTIAENQWRIKYSITGDEFGLLQIFVYKIGNDFPVATVANIMGTASDTSYVYKNGEFYLKINSANTNWSIIVEELR